MSDGNQISSTVTSEAQLEELLSEPYPEDVEFARQLEGDVMVLGAGGKMGPTLIRRMLRAISEAESDSTVYAVSRYSDSSVEERLQSWGAETIRADLLKEGALESLPDCENVIYLVGMKFGTTGQEPKTWAINAYLPGRIASRFEDSRITALSTGNVYPPVPVDSGGSVETDETGPVGEYAQSCLGRERVFQHFTKENGTPTCLLRLNYAVELRYGVLLDLAKRVYAEEPVPLEMGHVNVIWQGDANSACFRSLELADSPAEILNVTGPSVLSVRDLAEQFADEFGCDVTFEGEEKETALLNDASRCQERFAVPKMPVDDVVELVASWVEQDGPTLGKPTKFHVRDGEF
ncbi:NAD-dependent epimerase/dehydratase family protein [Natronosalvus rutilus]|uniref:NAD-dependent epimerase/dehydratase family protein n=1 Tax=Natronosalvus rutilus TaxID=2953753 RepID=A0A9E7SSF1_9EURY|nr:NAD-dependent epimerase/dehydratase family protein [Natronosalvus rutilus]UTF52449.1 NAD-dependent epimerase/dehydratase family protein [Natronosalvus rutilus]